MVAVVHADLKDIGTQMGMWLLVALFGPSYRWPVAGRISTRDLYEKAAVGWNNVAGKFIVHWSLEKSDCGLAREGEVMI